LWVVYWTEWIFLQKNFQQAFIDRSDTSPFTNKEEKIEENFIKKTDPEVWQGKISWTTSRSAKALANRGGGKVEC